MIVPSIKDVAGLGVLVGHVKELLLKLIENRAAREECRLKKQNLRIENTRKFLEVAKEFNLTPEQLKNYEILANDKDTPQQEAGVELIGVPKNSIKLLEAIPKPSISP